MKKPFLILTCLLAFACTKKPDSIGKNFVQDLADGKTDSAFKAVMPTYHYMSDEGIKAWLNENSTKLKAEGVKSVEVLKSQEENDVAILDVKIVNKKDQVLGMNIRLKKINGSWLIFDVN